MPPRCRHRRASLAALLALVVLGLSWGTAAAQDRTIDNIVTEQNRVIEKFRAPLEMQGRLGISVEENLVTAPEAKTISFRLTKVELTGATSVAPNKLEPIWQPYLGTVVRVEDLAKIAAGIEAYYRKADIYARAIVRKIDTKTGVVRVDVFEGYISEIIIDSKVPDLQKRLKPYLDRIAALVPLRISKLERELLLIADLGGYVVHAKLEQIPKQLGAGRLTLTIKRARFEGRFKFDNLSSPEMGPLELTGVATASDVLGLFEESSVVGVVNPTSPREFTFLNASQSIPLGTRGWRAGYAVSRIWSKPGGDLADQDVKIGQTVANLSIEYPVIRRIAYNLIASAEFNAQNNRVEVGPIVAVNDRTRWLTLSATYDEIFGSATLLSRVSASQGIDGLGATSGDRPQAGRYGGEPDFHRFDARLKASYDLGPSLSVSADIVGQLGLTALPDAVLLTIGGDPYGRAFIGSSVAGDSGAAGSFELRHPIDLGQDWLKRLSAFAFTDFGYVANHDTGAPFKTASLGSVGLGLRALLAPGIHVESYAAVPMIASSAVENDEGVSFRFAVGFGF